MRITLRIGLVLAAVAQAKPVHAQEGKRYAIVVGVNTYDHPKLEPLKYAVNDAIELGDVLAKAGYTVTVLTDDAGKKDPKLAPTKANIEGRLKAVLDGAKKGDLVLVGLAGHGLQFEGDTDAYFCASDAKPFKKSADTLVSLKTVYDGLNGSFAGMKVLLVDACRDDPAAGRGATADGSPPPPKGVAAIFSCKAGQRAFEHESLKHGVFFHHVIAGLRGEAADRKGRVTFAGLAAHVGQEVPSDVARLIKNGAVQSPNLKAEYTSEPLLVPRAEGAAGKTGDPVASDLAAFERATTFGRRVEFLKQEAPAGVARWRKAAEAGAETGQILYASCLVAGVGAEKDEKEAFGWFKKAAASGHPVGMRYLGAAYAEGVGVGKDEKEAVKWYTKAAEAGHPGGMNVLGLAHNDGVGGEPDEREAVKWFRRAAEAGHPVGMRNLGAMYEAGLGVEKDEREAVKWYTKAAEAGHPVGMRSLAAALESGRGVPKSEADAVAWYRKAAELGDRVAKDALKRIDGK